MFLLLGVAAVVTGFIGLCLLFYQATRKTYAGFGYWTAGVGFLALGYLFQALRGQIPFWITVLLGNYAFLLGMILHLDGIRRFLGLKPAPRLLYVLSLAVLAGLGLFYFQWDSATLRNLVAAIALTAVHWTMAALIFRRAIRPRSVFYKVIGSLLSFAGLLIIARAVWLVSAPSSDLIFRAPLEFAFITSYILVHLAENLSLILLTAERVESELMAATEDLSQSVASLEESLTKQKQTEESLRESEEKYRTFFDTSRDAVFITTVDGRFIDFNDVALDTLGYEQAQKEKVLGKKVSDFYANPEEREVHTSIVAKIGFSKEYPLDLRKQDGTIIHTLITTVARKDSQGNIIGFQGTVRDVTDRKKAEEALRQSEQRLSLALDGANLGIWDWDLTTGKALWSQRTLQMLGYEPNEIESDFRNWKKLVHPDDWPKVAESLNSHLAGRLPIFDVEYRIMNKSRKWQWVSARGKVIEFDEKGKPVRMTGIQADITDRKLGEEKLRRSEDRLELALKGADLAIWDYNLKTGEAVFNARRAEMVGYSLDEADQHFTWWSKQVHPEDGERVLKAFNDHAEGRSPLYECEHRLRHKSGEYIGVLARAKIVERDERGYPVRIVGTNLDITDRKKAAEERETLRRELLQAQKMEAIGTLTGGIAHDFNNLLTIINGFSEMILMGRKQDDPLYEDLRKIHETGLKGADMVRRLLSFAKQDATVLEPMDLNHRIEESRKLIERSFPKMIEIEAILSDDLGVLNGDAAQIDQVLMNLCINAKEAMPEGGRLRIETRNITVNEDYCRLHVGAKPGCYVLLEVSDTGSGMSKETMDRVFDPFFTTKGWDFRKGTGLSLPVAKGIVEQHGGWITCESEPGKGATFSVYFPVVEEPPVAQKREPVGSTGPSSKTIMLVDDEEYVGDLGRRILESRGYEVITASNGKEALDIYAREESNIGLVILDLIMPKMSGEKCLRELLKINPRLSVVISTGHSLDSEERDRIEALVKGFVDKPYEMKQLLNVVARVMDTEKAGR